MKKWPKNSEPLLIEVSPNKHVNYCGVRVTIEVLGGKWKFQILSLLYTKPKRYKDIVKEIPLASEKMILTSLRELEEHKVIERIKYDESPPRVEYQITEYGQSIKPVLCEIEQWGKKHAETYPDTVYFELKKE